MFLLPYHMIKENISIQYDEIALADYIISMLEVITTTNTKITLIAHKLVCRQYNIGNRSLGELHTTITACTSIVVILNGNE